MWLCEVIMEFLIWWGCDNEFCLFGNIKVLDFVNLDMIVEVCSFCDYWVFLCF